MPINSLGIVVMGWKAYRAGKSLKLKYYLKFEDLAIYKIIIMRKRAYLNKIAGVVLLFFPIIFYGQSADQLVVCGDTQVLIIEVSESKDTSPQVVWQWNAEEALDLPELYRTTYFKTIDECKPVENGDRILITASSGGVALIEKSNKQVVFYARVGNAHSAELLPNNRIVVAGSTNAAGNRLELFDVNTPEKPLFQDSLYSGHGVLWDQENRLLYALGYKELRAYRLSNWTGNAPSLERQSSWTIPGAGGHDLVAFPNDHVKLLLSEHGSVWLFDKSKEVFEPFAPLEDREDVKGISLHEVTGRLAFVQAETSWWSHRVYLTEPDQWFSFPDIRLYKVRWMPDR